MEMAESFEHLGPAPTPHTRLATKTLSISSASQQTDGTWEHETCRCGGEASSVGATRENRKQNVETEPYETKRPSP